MSVARFFSRRWNGQASWRELLWNDMLGVGTVVNVLATFLALGAAIKGADTAVVALLHFAPLPYNFFLFASLWRTPQRPAFATIIAAAWLVIVFFI